MWHPKQCICTRFMLSEFIISERRYTSGTITQAMSTLDLKDNWGKDKATWGWGDWNLILKLRSLNCHKVYLEHSRQAVHVITNYHWRSE